MKVWMHPQMARRGGRCRMCEARLLAIALVGLLLAACAAGPAAVRTEPLGATRLPADQTAQPPAARTVERPAGQSRDALLSQIAACHLRRVAQNADRGATDAVVIAAVERYGFSVSEMVARSNALLLGAADPSAREALRDLARKSCDQLAVLTGTSPSLVRFNESGRLDNTWVVVNGEIGEGFADEVIGRLRGEKAVGLVISSPGGSLYEARRLGRYLRDNGLRVGVSGLCTSACVDVMAGGIERYVTSGAKLGIHQSKVPEHLSSHEGGQLSVVAAALYLREMGVDDSIALAAAAIPNNSMYWISVPEALETGLATQLVSRL